MSGKETVQQVYEALGMGDLPTALGLMSPQVRWHEPPSLPFGDQVGPEAIVQNVLAVVPDLLDGFAVEVSEVLDAGTAVVALGRYRGTSTRTGRQLDADFAHVWRCDEDGRIASLDVHTDTARWREVLGTDQPAPVPVQTAGGTAPAATTL